MRTPKPYQRGQRLLGLRGQNMAGHRLATSVRILSTGDGVFMAPSDGVYRFYLYACGGRGGDTDGFASSHGAGGGASKITRYLRAGDRVAYHVPSGAAGEHATLTFPDGWVVDIPPGGSGDAGFAIPGRGSIGRGGDVNRRGGDGTGNTNPDGDPDTSDGTTYPSLPPTGGGVTHLAGGGAGFIEEIPDLVGDGADTVATAGSQPGGGGAGRIGAGSGGRGGHGALQIVGPT